jgi:hypothetical protein
MGARALVRPPSRMLEPKWGMEEWRYERRSGGTVDSWMRCGNNIHPGTVYMSECVSGRGYDQVANALSKAEGVMACTVVGAETNKDTITFSSYPLPLTHSDMYTALLKAFAT